MFSIANLFSIPISQAMPLGQSTGGEQKTVDSPNGRAGEGARVSLRMGIRAFGRGLT